MRKGEERWWSRRWWTVGEGEESSRRGRPPAALQSSCSSSSPGWERTMREGQKEARECGRRSANSILVQLTVRKLGKAWSAEGDALIVELPTAHWTASKLLNGRLVSTNKTRGLAPPRITPPPGGSCGGSLGSLKRP